MWEMWYLFQEQGWLKQTYTIVNIDVTYRYKQN